MMRSHISILILLLSSTFLFCQNTKNYKFYHLDTEDNLSQNTIHCMLQDKQGYMWFGTNSGLNRWNGYKFNRYIHDAKDTNSIGQGRVNCIIEDEDGVIWIGTFQDGISRFNSKTNSFTNYRNSLGLNEGLMNNAFQIVKMKDKIIYGTFGRGLFLLNIASKKSTKINLFNKQGDLLQELFIQKLVFDRDSNLWIGHSQGLLMVNKANIDSNITELNAKCYLFGSNVEAISLLKNYPLLIGTQFNGMFYYDRRSNNVKEYTLPVHNWEEISNSAIRDFIIDKYENLWIATDANGIYTVGKNQNIIHHYQNELNNYFTLSSDNVYCLYKDIKHNIWIGTYNNGINYINYHKQSFNHSRGFGKNNELNNNAVLSFCELPDKKILIGTDGGGINVYNRKTETYNLLQIPIEKETPSKKAIVCMKQHEDKLYIGTYLLGFFIYNLKTKVFKNYQAGHGKYDLKNNNIWSIAIDNKERIWLATLGNGLFCFDPTTEKFRNYITHADEPNSLSDNYISNLLIDSENRLWVGTFNSGLNILVDEEKEIFKLYKRDSIAGLSSNEISKIFEDSDKNIWVGTQDGGLCLLNKRTDKFRTFNTTDGLPSNAVKSIIEDKNKNLWLGTNRGLVKFYLESSVPVVRTYKQQDGLQGNEFNFNASYKTKDGYLFVGGNNGFNFFHPDSLTESKEVGSMVIENIKVLYHDNYSGESISVLKDTKENTINLDYNLAMITIEYSLLDFTVPELNTYEYMLEGFDKNWISSVTSNKVTYTNLDPGEYTFKVKGINNLGIITPEAKTLNIIIEPPFWARLWFKLALLLFIIGASYLFYKQRIRMYNKHEKQLKKAVKERTEKLVSLNKILADRNKEIQKQSFQLKHKSENLSEVNANLENSKKQIEQQNLELENHRNNLEQLVEARTKELELAKAKAIESEQLKMAFLANMSHEIRTPMNAIVGFSSLLSMKGYSQKERSTFTDLINSNSNSLLLLIDDILDLSRLEANQLIVKKEKFNIVNLLNEVVANWTVIHKDKDVKFDHKINITEKVITINSDKSRIKQIINNLIDNAFKFTNHGKVSFIAEIKSNKILIKVSDTGIGIEKHKVPIIFNRFIKNDESDNKSYRGAGLGLAISKKLSVLLNGKLWVESELKQGSDFFFELPL